VSFYESGKKGFIGWITSTDHKRIGLLYFYSLTAFFLTAVMLGLVMRLELLTPEGNLVEPQTYNGIFTLHGVMMIFLFVIPGIPAVFGNIAMPIMIGAKDVAFPRLNLMSWYMYVAGAFIALSTLVVGELPDTGWTFYAPYSVEMGNNVILAALAAFILGFSSILTGLNFLTTIHRLRAPGMKWFDMPLFAWALYATGWIQLLATPVVGITLLMLVAEKALGVGLFDPALGGDPVLYQHLFWIYSHPAVYIMVLPGMGVVSEIIPVFAKRKIFGYKAIAYSSLAIAFVGYFVWGHHMYTSGMSGPARVIFSVLTFLVAIPSAIKVFNWLATLYKGSIDLGAPLLYTLGFIFLFLIGGLTGLVNGALAADIHLHDTYFVVGHFHYVMFGGTGYAFFAAMHYWFPKITGRVYSQSAAKTAFWVQFVGFNMLYFPMLILGMMGMPRRYYSYLPEFEFWNQVSTLGSWVMVAGLLAMFGILARAWNHGERVGRNPWGGLTLEWTVESPPTLFNFAKIPVVSHGPYDYDKIDMTQPEEARA